MMTTSIRALAILTMSIVSVPSAQVVEVEQTTLMASSGLQDSPGRGSGFPTLDAYRAVTRLPLVLNPERVAARGLAAADWRTESIEATALQPWPIADWVLADLPQANSGSPIDRVRQVVGRLAGRTRNGFVSPVFVGLYGGPVIVTPVLLVAFEEGHRGGSARSIIESFAELTILAEDWADMPGSYKVEVLTTNAFRVLDLAVALIQCGGVRHAEPDWIFTGRSAHTPDDPGFPEQWGLHNTGQNGGVADMDMNAPEAWVITMGISSIQVLVIDDGVQQDHPDISQNGGADLTSEGPGDGGPTNGWDTHGTPVAGCVSATIDNALGVAGIAPYCPSVSARTFISTGPGSWTSQASWTVDALAFGETIGVRVTNNSNGYGFTHQDIDDKYQATRDAGMVHFASAGNDSSSVITYPASLPTVLAIGSITRTGAPSDFSNYGPDIAFTAPGSEILSTDRTGTDGYSDGDFATVQGTSFASPYSAGIAALLLSLSPGLDADQVETALRNGAKDLGIPGFDTTYGWGLLDARGALTAADAVIQENFDGGAFPPSGWTVVDNTGNGTWDTSSAFAHGNEAGSGEAAAIDSDAYGTVDIDGELITPAFDLPGELYVLEFDHYYNHYPGGGSEVGDVDIRVGGGAWVNLRRYTGSDSGGHVSLPLSDYGGATGVQLRFHYYQANYDLYWHVDNVAVRASPLDPPPTLLWMEDFDGGSWPPVGWTVVDNLGNGSWYTSSFYGSPNYTRGTGECAEIDSDYIGPGDVDTELITPAFDIPDEPTFLTFRNEFDWEIYGLDEIGDVDIGTWGGTWTNLLRFQGDDNTADQTIDLSAYAGQTAMIRFHYYQARDEEWWQIDDVCLYMNDPSVPGIPFCFGDPGSGTPCPCSNDNDGSIPGSGCDNGIFASGANLTGSGVASLSNDTVVLSTTNLEPNNAGLYFQADNDLSPGIAWGDGLRCAGGNLKRLGVRFSDGNGDSDTSGYPHTISAKAGNVLAGDTKYYQCWYRTTANPPCGPGVNEFNTSNGYAITWWP